MLAGRRPQSRSKQRSKAGHRERSGHAAPAGAEKDCLHGDSTEGSKTIASKTLPSCATPAARSGRRCGGLRGCAIALKLASSGPLPTSPAVRAESCRRWQLPTHDGCAGGVATMNSTPTGSQNSMEQQPRTNATCVSARIKSPAHGTNGGADAARAPVPAQALQDTTNTDGQVSVSNQAAAIRGSAFLKRDKQQQRALLAMHHNVQTLQQQLKDVAALVRSILPLGHRACRAATRAAHTWSTRHYTLAHCKATRTAGHMQGTECKSAAQNGCSSPLGRPAIVKLADERYGLFYN